MWRRRPLVVVAYVRAKARGNLLGLHCLPAQEAIDASPGASARAPIITRVVPAGPEAGSIGEAPNEQDRFRAAPGCRVNQQQLGAGSIITRLEDLRHCIERMGWAPPGPYAGARRGRGRLVCLSGPCSWARAR